MSSEVELTAGGNLRLDGRETRLTVRAANLGGVLVVAEEHATMRALEASDPMAPVTGAGADVQVTVVLSAVPDTVERLRVVAWSSQQTRLIEPAQALVEVDGHPLARVELAAGQQLRAAELLELYRRHGDWKVRAIVSGWVGGIDAAAAAIGIEPAAFRPLRAPAAASRSASASRSVGPVVLRPLIDEIVGPGEREGNEHGIGFQLGGGQRAEVVTNALTDELTAVTAVLPLGRGAPAGGVAEAAARTSGEAPMGRIAFDHGDVFASASTVVDRHALDTAVVKALLSEAWTTALDFTGRGSMDGWRGTRLPAERPRELRLGIAEDLGEISSWAEIREMLITNDFMPLVDAPQACLAPADGTLWLGPVRLAGAPRAWSVLCERVLRADAVLSGEAWREIAAWNTVTGPMRLGVVQEVGVDAPPAVVLNFNALQVQRGQPRRDLEIGLGLVDERAAEIEPGLRSLIAGTNSRNNLPWFPARRWSGPGREIADDILARELSGLSAGAAPPADFVSRVRARYDALGRGGAGYLGHLALERAERGDAEQRAWFAVASELLELAPVQMGADGTATASIHVRRGRVGEHLSPTPRQPAPSPRDSVPEPLGQPRKRRWFGG